MLATEELIIICLLLVIVYLLFLLSAKNRQLNKVTTEPQAVPVETSIPAAQTKIIMFGEFRMVNPEGTDVHHNLTPKLKELLLVLILYTFRKSNWEKGIPIKRLDEFLWSNISYDNLKNNRTVNISKLKKVLADIPELKIINENNHLTISFDGKVFCDYVEIKKISNKFRTHNSLTEEEEQIFLGIIEQGSFLRDINHDWLDEIKIELNEEVSDIFEYFANKLMHNGDDKQLYKIGKLFYNFDPLSETALKIIVKVYHRQGKHGSAKDVYQHYKNEYLKTFGEEYKAGYNELMN